METFPAGTPRLAGRPRRPGTDVVHPGLREITSGVVRRRLRLDDGDETVALELAHGCVSCTRREDLLPLLRTLTRLPQVKRIARAARSTRHGWTMRSTCCSTASCAPTAGPGWPSGARWRPLRRDPVFGDRAREMVVVTDQTLRGVLRTDQELAAGKRVWTGNRRIMDTAGQVEKFRRRYGQRGGGK